MALITSVLLAVTLLASATAWWSARRLPFVPNLERLARRARCALVAEVVGITAGTGYVVAAALGDRTAGSFRVDPGRAALLAVPLLVALAVAVPRTWVVVRRRGGGDPLSWVHPGLRAELSAPALVVPSAALVLATVATVLVPAQVIDLPYGMGVVGTGFLVLLATIGVDSRVRRRAGRALVMSGARASSSSSR